MQVTPFIADSAADAVAQIRAQLGPEAMVLDVRPLPSNGVSRLWRKPRIEVLACIPEKPAPVATDAIDVLRAELAEIRQRLPVAQALASRDTDGTPPPQNPDWRMGAVLEKAGLLPVHARTVVNRVCELFGNASPDSLEKQVSLAQAVLTQLWRQPPALGLARPDEQPTLHVFVGSPGVGKTTCLCKWLTQTVLMESATARVWRLDGRIANTAESLSVHCDILGVPVERSEDGLGEGTGTTIGFVDLPGIAWRDVSAMTELAARCRRWPSAQVHLVLNAAYDAATLLQQTHTFSALPISDLIVTHLDEETRWGKVWNLVSGTNFPVSFLSAGQNIPGEFFQASPQRLLSRGFSQE